MTGELKMNNRVWISTALVLVAFATGCAAKAVDNGGATDDAVSAEESSAAATDDSGPCPESKVADSKTCTLAKEIGGSVPPEKRPYSGFYTRYTCDDDSVDFFKDRVAVASSQEALYVDRECTTGKLWK
jgi:hypothetical protein